MSLVLDSSATLAWIYSDETTEAIRQLFDRIAEEGAIVPQLWRLEVATALAVGARRGRIAREACRAGLLDLALLDIAIDPHTSEHAWTTIFDLAERWGLSVYDSAYLELGQRRMLPLATLDGPLRRAAADSGVALLGMDG